MQKETEVKLRVSRETLAALREHPLLKKRNKSGWERLELSNQYFDTPERELAHAKVALRIRRDGDQIIQTMKTRGQSVPVCPSAMSTTGTCPRPSWTSRSWKAIAGPSNWPSWTRKPSSRCSPPISCARRLRLPGAVARPKW